MAEAASSPPPRSRSPSSSEQHGADDDEDISLGAEGGDAAALLASLSMTPPIPSGSPSPAGAPVALSVPASLSHQAVSLMLCNNFAACRAHAEQYGAVSAPSTLIGSYMLFIQAASSYADSELTATLSYVWALEKRASQVKTVENRLVRADCFFLGSLVQLINQSHVKCAWNMRKSWNHYVTAQKDLQKYRGADRDELLGWCQYGNGFFLLVMSLLPPSLLTVAGWAGYGGDREAGLALLHRSQQSGSFMAPIACLVLLSYYVSVASLTGEPDESFLPHCDALFEWADARYPNAVLFLTMRSRYWRCKRNPAKAIEVAKLAIHNCRELPSVAVLFHFNTGWCSFFLLDWQQSAHYFDMMIHAEPGGGYVPPAGEPKVSPEEAALIAEEQAGPHYARLPPAQASALTFYALMVGINYMLLKRPHKARYYFSLVPKLVKPGEKVSKPIDIYAKRKAAEYLARKTDRPEDALLDACELILTWNGSSQMTAESCKSMLGMLDAALAVKIPTWGNEQLAAVHLYKADMLKGLGETQQALAQMDLFSKYLPKLEKSSKAKADGTVAFAHYTIAFLLVDAGRVPQAAEHLKKASAIQGYDQYQQMQLRMHALSERILRLLKSQK